MLWKISLDENFRALTSHSFSTVEFGESSFLYGSNGSGKSTLGSFFYKCSTEGSPCSFTWTDGDGEQHSVARSEFPEWGTLHVFNDDWIEENISGLFDKGESRGIVTLGADAAKAQEREDELRRQLDEVEAECSRHRNTSHAQWDATGRLLKRTSNEIYDSLHHLDSSYSRSKYSVPNIKGRLQRGDYKVLDEATVDALRQKSAEVRQPPLGVPEIDLPSCRKIDDVAAFLARPVANQPVIDFKSASEREAWARGGLAIHDVGDECSFCGGKVTADRMQLLRAHFSDEWNAAIEHSTRLQLEVKEYRDSAIRYSTWLAGARVWHSTAAERAGDVEAKLASDIELNIRLLEELSEGLRIKAADPATSIRGIADQWRDLAEPHAQLVGLIAEHNRLSESHLRDVARAREDLAGAIVGSVAQSYQAALSAKEDADGEVRRCEARLQKLRDELATVLAKKFATEESAHYINEVMERVFGEGHLQLRVTEDGKSYGCWRGEARAEHLSEGERLIMGLGYFLRAISAERKVNSNADQFVVVDDPSRVLDHVKTHTVFAMLREALVEVSQSVIMTHDFDLLRCMLVAHNGDWMLREGGKNPRCKEEVRKYRFLQARALGTGEARAVTVTHMPDYMRKNISEYSYLFGSLVDAAKSAEPGQEIYLLPNAARRVLEILSSYSAPNETDFRAALERMAEDARVRGGSPATPLDIYSIVNMHSHGEGRETFASTDPGSVQQFVIQCLLFIQDVDDQHFYRMCCSVGEKDVSGFIHSLRRRAGLPKERSRRST